MKALSASLVLMLGTGVLAAQDTGAPRRDASPCDALTLPPLTSVPGDSRPNAPLPFGPKQNAGPRPAPFTTGFMLVPDLNEAPKAQVPDLNGSPRPPQPANGNGNGGNGNGNDDPDPLGFVGGAGFYFMQPRFSTNPAFFRTSTVTNGAGTTSVTRTSVNEFDWDFQMAPLFWVGYAFGDDWMVRGRYWFFNESSQPVSVTHSVDAANTISSIGTVGVLPFTSSPLPPGAPADIIRLGSTLRVDVIDIELAHSVLCGSWWLQFAAGARLAELEQFYNADLTNAGNAALGLAGRLNQQREESSFHGAGPTVYGQAFYLLGGGFSLYADGRASILYGRSHQAASQLFLGGLPAEQTFAYNNTHDFFLPIGEIELGLGWATDLGRTRWLFKTGFVGQIWWDGGSASIPPGGTAVQSPNFSNNVIPLATATSSNLGFLGWTVTVGVQF